ncbi:MAG: glycosyltransferase, partial [Pirellulaceae bacterium]|nr:glycosyltransferase [Pirellulaceae bacterium]
MFAKLNSDPKLEVTVLHGSSVPDTKLINGDKLDGFDHIEHFTIKRKGHTWVFHPFIFFSLVRLKPDAILSEGGSNFLSNFLILTYAILFRKPVIWWTLGELQNEKQSSRMRKLYLFLITAQEKLSSVYLGYSSVALAYFQRMGYQRSNCFRAVNCVDTNKVFQDIANRQSEAEALGNQINPERNAVILFVGALTKGKKIDRLLFAFKKILEANPSVKLVIVGDGTDRGRLEEQVQQLGVEHATHFAGSVISGVSDYFENADIFVLPGLGGLAVSEALAHGIPVICSRGDGCEVDLVRNGQTGYRIESDDDQIVI